MGVKGVTFYFSCDSAPVGVYLYFICSNFTYIMYILIRFVYTFCITVIPVGAFLV